MYFLKNAFYVAFVFVSLIGDDVAWAAPSKSKERSKSAERPPPDVGNLSVIRIDNSSEADGCTVDMLREFTHSEESRRNPTGGIERFLSQFIGVSTRFEELQSAARTTEGLELDSGCNLVTEIVGAVSSNLKDALRDDTDGLKIALLTDGCFVEQSVYFYEGDKMLYSRELVMNKRITPCNIPGVHAERDVEEVKRVRRAAARLKLAKQESVLLDEEPIERGPQEKLLENGSSILIHPPKSASRLRSRASLKAEKEARKLKQLNGSIKEGGNEERKRSKSRDKSRESSS